MMGKLDYSTLEERYKTETTDDVKAEIEVRASTALVKSEIEAAEKAYEAFSERWQKDRDSRDDRSESLMSDFVGVLYGIKAQLDEDFVLTRREALLIVKAHETGALIWNDTKRAELAQLLERLREQLLT